MPPLATVKIHELSPLTVGLDLDGEDKLPIHISAENKTKRVKLSELNTWFALGGGGGSHPPSVWGGKMVYIVPSLLDGTTVAPIPSLAGKDFSLNRAGTPLIALLPDNSNASIAEFEILNTGGFRLLLPGDVLTGGERFELTIFSLIGTGGGSTTVNNFIVGKKVITSNVSLDPVDDVNKIIQFRGANDYITCTIPDLANMAANTFYILDTSVAQNKPVTILTTGGQYIYMNKSSWTTLHMMPGEMCWIYRDVDGFYVINDFGDHYKNLGNPVWSYKKGLNQVVFNGTEILRADYPRLFNEVKTFGTSYVTKSVWETVSATVDGRTVDRPYRGCWYDGDEATTALTFGTPDFLNSFIRSVKTESGSDSQRHLNKPGGFQDDMNKSHNHQVNTTGNQGSVDPGRAIQRSATNGDGFSNGSGATNYIENSGGAEARPVNIGMLPVCNA